jgi:quercetin dioxygenase-like cupin family protein
MLLLKSLKTGDLNGVIFDFEKVENVLEKHIHDEFNNHITIVCSGKLKAYSHDWEIEATPSQVIDFRIGEPHELMALEDNTRIINIFKKANGIPNDYDKA